MAARPRQFTIAAPLAVRVALAASLATAFAALSTPASRGLGCVGATGFFFIETGWMACTRTASDGAIELRWPDLGGQHSTMAQWFANLLCLPLWLLGPYQGAVASIAGAEWAQAGAAIGTPDPSAAPAARRTD